MPFDEGENRGGGGSGGTEDLTAVLFFLHGAASETTMHNTYTGREAFDAFARLIGRDPEGLWSRIEARHG